jgi:uncharacterized protein YndB with AHSA1/START domain
MLVTLLVALALLVVGVLAFAGTRPDSFRVARSVVIAAPAERIFPLLDDFHRWTAWSPYEGIDPTLQRKYSGVERGVGAIYEWSGNGKAGKGRMEIVGEQPPGKLVIKLDFEKPFEGHNVAEFTIRPSGSGHEVVWAMGGPSPFMSKLMGLFMNLDRLIGKDFELGLANLKRVAEGPIPS